MAISGLRAAFVSGVLAVLLAWLFSLTPAADRIENQYGLGLLYALRGPLPPPEGAIVVAIDNQTIDWLRESAEDSASMAALACMPSEELRELGMLRGPSSLPRSIHACLLERLGAMGFPAVAFDVLFSAPSSEEDDSKFAAALKSHGAAAILTGIERATVRNGEAELLVEREVQPLQRFRDSAAATGIFLVPKSGGPVYGYLRKAPGFGDTPSLPHEVQRLIAQASDAHVTSSVSNDQAFEYLWLYGPPGSILTVSASDILSGHASDALRSLAPASAAFVGASDPDASNYPDSFPSFFRSGIGADISGVELLATAFLNEHTGNGLREPGAIYRAAPIVLFAFALGFLAWARSGLAMMVAPLAGIVYVAGAVLVFSRLHQLPPVGTPVFVVAPAAFVAAVFIRYRFARGLIMRLAPAPAARRMLTRRTDQRGVAETQEATIVFFDLIGSTAIAEKVAPADFNKLLNIYFDSAVANVEAQHGEVAAFSGDGIVAVFTGSHRHQNHAIRACLAVIAILQAMRTVNVENTEGGLPALHMRVGINSGDVAAGEIGARDRFNFSVVGDVVNLASRLEQMGKTLFPGESEVVLVGASTHAMASSGDELAFRDCGARDVRGRERQERVFRLETP